MARWDDVTWECVDADGPRDLRWFADVSAPSAEEAAVLYADERWEATGTSPRVVACRQAGSAVVHLVTLRVKPKPVMLVEDVDVGGPEASEHFERDRNEADDWVRRNA